MAKPGSKHDRFSRQISSTPALPSAAAWDAAFVNAGLHTPEELYQSLVPLEHRRRLAQFFTPPAIANLMAAWISLCSPKTVLDPAVGPGVLVRALRRIVPSCRVTAIDLDPSALDAAKAALHGLDAVELVHADFLTWNTEATFDAILANPPYLKHHNMLYEEDIHGIVGQRNGIRLSRLTNLYALFILEACRRLRPGGRAAILVPGEWTNSNFGDPLKEFLLSRGLLKVLVYFSHAQLVFDGALTTASVLLLENNGRPAPVTTAFVESDCAVDDLAALFGESLPGIGGAVVRQLSSEVLLAEKKWNHLLRHGTTSPEPGWVPLSAMASTRRGIATGANQFFHVRAASLRAWRVAPTHALPCVGRAVDIAGLVFDQGCFQQLEAGNKPCFLLSFAQPPELNTMERDYLARGEAEGLPSRYLLAGRSPWYAMEDRPPAPIWAAVFGRKGLRFLWNQTNTRNLTAFHCIYPRSTNSVFAGALTAVLNSSEVQNRSRQQCRVYGGGLLKFEPKDLLDIQVPDLREAAPDTLAALANELVRINKTASSEASTLSVLLDRLVARAAHEATASTGHRAQDPFPAGTTMPEIRK